MTSPVLAGLVGDFGLDIAMERGGDGSITIREPEQRLLRDLISDVRKFDSPGEDVFAKNLHQLLAARLTERWQPGLEQCRQAYELEQEPREYRVEDPDVPRLTPPPGPNDENSGRTWIRPREAFELWVYGDHLRNDYAKEQRFERLNPIAKGMVRAMGHNYLDMLTRQIEFFGRSIRNGLTLALDPPLPPQPEPPSPPDARPPGRAEPRRA